MKQIKWELLLPTHPHLDRKLSEQEEEQFWLSLYGRSRRSIIGSHLEIKKKRADEFWKTYKAFQDKKHSLLADPTVGKNAALPVEVVHTAEIKKTDKELNRAAALSKAYAKYERKFRKLVGKEQSFRLMQLELQLDSGIISVMQLREGNKG